LARLLERVTAKDHGPVRGLDVMLSSARRYHHRKMGSYWAATQQRCYTTPCAGFLVMKDLKQKVQWLEDVQKMELGVEPTLSA